MNHCYRFCVIQFPAHPLRNERLNLGLAVFRDGFLDVRPARRLDKIRAISAAIDPSELHQSLISLCEIDLKSATGRLADVDDRWENLGSVGGFEFSPLGDFIAPSDAHYENQISLLLSTLVEPEPAPASAAKKRPTPLRREIKKALRDEKVLARRGEGLEAHRVMTNQVIAEGLSADFLLKNGAMHIIETVDASSDDVSFRRMVTDVAISALVFERGRMNFVDNETTAQLVYHASPAVEVALTPSLAAAEHQGAKLVNWASTDDRRLFIVSLTSLATPFATAQKNHQTQTINASAQHKFKLN